MCKINLLRLALGIDHAADTIRDKDDKDVEMSLWLINIIKQKLSDSEDKIKKERAFNYLVLTS